MAGAGAPGDRSALRGGVGGSEATPSAVDARVVAALFVFALAVRVGVALRTAVIFNDGPIFLRVAGSMVEGDWSSALGHHYHPLYPLLTAGAYQAIGDLELAGVTVSVIAGAIAVVALYAFLRQAFDPQVAWIGGVLLSIQPYAAAFSADVQSDGLYTALFLSAVACSWRGLARGRPSNALAAGVLIGLAYLVRPEGLGLLVPVCTIALLRVVRSDWTASAGARWLAALVLGTAFLAGPYVGALYAETGEWMLTQKKSISDLTTPKAPVGVRAPGVPNRERWRPPSKRRPAPREAALFASHLVLPARIEGEPRALTSLFELVRVSGGAFSMPFVLLLALGIHTVRSRPGERALFLSAILLVYAVVLYGLLLNAGYLSRRHVLTPLLPLLGYAALAVPALGRALLPSRVSATRATCVCLVLVALVTLPKTLGSHREERLATRRAAEWLASRDDLTGPVAAEKSRDAYYAGEAYIDFSRGGAGADPAALRRAGARFLIVDEPQLANRAPLRAAVRAGLRELHRTRVAGRTAFVYELRPAPD